MVIFANCWILIEISNNKNTLILLNYCWCSLFMNRLFSFYIAEIFFYQGNVMLFIYLTLDKFTAINASINTKIIIG